jgi:hypothetical protein
MAAPALLQEDDAGEPKVVIVINSPTRVFQREKRSKEIKGLKKKLT